MLLPFNTSAFSNVLGTADRAAQRKALVSSSDEFDGKPEDVHQHIAQFTQHCISIKMPLASRQLVSFQYRQCIYVLLMTVWTSAMKSIMLQYQELHDNDGIVLW